GSCGGRKQQQAASREDQKISGHHGCRSQRNSASARISAPSFRSSARPARASELNETPPRYAEPSDCADKAMSASSSVRAAEPPSSSQRSSFQGQKSSCTSKTTAPSTAYLLPDSGSPPSTRRTQRPSPIRYRSR